MTPATPLPRLVVNKSEARIIWEALSAHVENTEDSLDDDQNAPEEMLYLLEKFDAIYAEPTNT